MANKQTNILKNVRLKHPKKVCLSHININFIRNKLDSLFEFTYGLVNLLAVSEIKLDNSFPTGQFNLKGFRTPLEKILCGRVNYPVDTGHKLNVHKTFRRHPGCLLNVLCTFNLRPVSTGYLLMWIVTSHPKR